MARERGLHAPEPDTNVSRPEKFSKRSCNSKGSAVISVETSRQKTEPSQREGRVEESKVLSGELVGGRDAPRLPRNAEHRNRLSYRCGGRDPTRILLKPKGVR